MVEIVETEGVMGGQPRLKGRRISVLQISEWILDEGMDPEEVSEGFDLDLSEVYGALSYYYENIEEMKRWRERRNRRIRESRKNQPNLAPAE